MRTPSEAIAWANAQASWGKFMCLNFVDNAYFPGEQTPLGANGVRLAIAADGWAASRYQVTDGSEPPIGALMYFAGVPGDTDGDVQIYIGNHETRRTDVGAPGVVGTVDWKWMETVNGHPYLGWTRDILGAITFPDTPATPIDTGELTVAQYDELLKTITANQAHVQAVLDKSGATNAARIAWGKVVTAQYKSYVHRAPNAQESATWVAYFEAGGNTATLVDHLKAYVARGGK